MGERWRRMDWEMEREEGGDGFWVGTSRPGIGRSRTDVEVGRERDYKRRKDGASSSR